MPLLLAACGDGGRLDTAGGAGGSSHPPDATTGDDGGRSVPDASAEGGAVQLPDAGSGAYTADGSAGPCSWMTPGAPWLAFCSAPSGNYDVYVIRTDGSCLERLTTDAADDLYPTWSPDGRNLAFASTRAGVQRIWIHDRATGTETRLDTGDLRATSPAWSPDGTAIAFEGGAAAALKSSDIYLVPAAGGVPSNLSNAPANTANAGPAWAPDGSTIYFVSNRDGPYDLYALPVSGDATSTSRLTTKSTVVGKPAVSPDGARLAYARGTSYTEVVTFELTARITQTVSMALTDSDSEPSWDPSGTRLAVRSLRDGHADLFVVDASTGAQSAQLTNDVVLDGAPAFAPLH